MKKTFIDGASRLEFPTPPPPAFGEVVQIRDGLLWARLPLPYLVDHLNLYFLRDGAGWAVIDTGIRTEEALAAWESLLDGPLRGLRLTQVIATHFHADHIGLAGWLCQRFRAPLLTSLSSYMTSRVLSVPPEEAALRSQAAFYESHGLDQATAQFLASGERDYPQRIGPLPEGYSRLASGDVLTIGKRSFQVLSGDGHAPEQILLYCARERLLFAADQIMEKVTPNITFPTGDRQADPLGHFLRSTGALCATIPSDVLVLPGHLRPFIGLHWRFTEIERRLEDRCALIRDACRQRPASVAELVSILYPKQGDPRQIGFAFTETLAAVNRLIRCGEVTTIRQGDRLLQATSVCAA
ncbi:MBL fold metallo-hydrolase [Phaeovulum sp. NW3]|uniref:MBL fold metallo-hydrolase n=1 Tax=Phaeovulum sp. NW3 TaxID=2934933 RepID=UPI0020226417|nr:MBL fold metallo-hydrolase [Phaeovulum sp. NW3]MCL7466268.1 MBL fold metallo-hydrolase [Phaeovulum sp. NW3]